ncbi:MAG: hydrogenase expression/formation protein HypE [candidate division WOR-3 bacterium]
MSGSRKPNRTVNSLPSTSDSVITLAHGSGGRKMHRLIRGVFARHFRNPLLERREDAAIFSLPGPRLSMTTDSFVVQPYFFPGGDIGKLAVCGTANDLAVMGATPIFMSAGFVITAGFRLDELERICRSMARTARAIGVQIVTGDTKVIESSARSSLVPPPDTNTLPGSETSPPSPDIFINTTGIGLVRKGLRLGAEHIRAGDKIIISGSIGDHEAAIALARGEYGFKARLASDCASVSELVGQILDAGIRVRMMRDPTRGGIATTLNEIADAAGLGIIIDETHLQIRAEVRGVCDLLGLDPLYLACEGKVVFVIPPDSEQVALATLHHNRLGRLAATIGQVTEAQKGVWLKTRLGSLRPVLMLEGQQLPRIC